MQLKMSELVSQFEAAEIKVSQLLSAATEPSTSKVRELDDELKRAFTEVIGAQLNNSDEVLERIHFLIGRIRNVTEEKEIAAELGDKVIADVQFLLMHNEQISNGSTPIVDAPDAIIETSYTSKAVSLFSDHEIYELCAEAQKFNHRNKITGALSYNKFTGSVFQILEGPAQPVQNLMKSIKNDIRHTDIRMRFQGPISSRNYDRWSMFLIPTSEISTQDT